MISLYRSPSQTRDGFNEFWLNYEQILSEIIFWNPSSLFITGDINVRTSSWWRNDAANLEGTQAEALACFYGLNQIIFRPTHILRNWSSCIELIFTNEPNFVIGTRVHPSLHANFHHQITFLKVKLKMKYPPTYEQLVCDYKSVGLKHSIKQWKALTRKNNFITKILMIMHFSLMKLLSIFVTPIFQINM